ncbi:hexapeptide transferase [Methylobacterium sp. A49B]
MADFLLVGGSGFANEIYDWFVGPLASQDGRIVGFLQDEAYSGMTSPALAARLPHLGPVQPEIAKDYRLIMAAGDPGAKAVLGARFPSREAFATVRHPTSLVSDSAVLGKGILLAPFSMVSASAVVHDFVTVNSHSSIGHDATVGEAATLSSYVDVTGYVQVGAQSFWGSGARALPKVRIGERTRIGAGAVVFRHVPDGATVFAAPARRL